MHNHQRQCSWSLATRPHPVRLLRGHRWVCRRLSRCSKAVTTCTKHSRNQTNRWRRDEHGWQWRIAIAAHAATQRAHTARRRAHRRVQATVGQLVHAHAATANCRHHHRSCWNSSWVKEHENTNSQWARVCRK
jgi:hypothetical protein